MEFILNQIIKRKYLQLYVRSSLSLTNGMSDFIIIVTNKKKQTNRIECKLPQLSRTRIFQLYFIQS
jgi:hypothetical protein